MEICISLLPGRSLLFFFKYELWEPSNLHKIKCYKKQQLRSRYREETRWRKWKKMFIFKPRRESLRETDLVPTLISDLKPPELWENKLLLVKCPKKQKEGRRKEISLGSVSWSCSPTFQSHQLQFDFSGARNELEIAWTAVGFCTFLDLGSRLPHPTLSFTANSHCPSWETLPKPQVLCKGDQFYANLSFYAIIFCVTRIFATQEFLSPQSLWSSTFSF